MFYLNEASDGIVLKIHLQPRASKNEFVGFHADAVKIRLTAPPVEGAANAACIEYIAKLFGVSRADVEIVSGYKSRDKFIKVKTSKEKVLAILRQG